MPTLGEIYLVLAILAPTHYLKPSAGTTDEVLLLQIVDKETGEPIIGAPVGLGLANASASFRFVDSFEGTVGDLLLTDDTGSVRFTVKHSEKYDAYVNGSASGHRSSIVHIEALKKGEARERRVELPRQFPIPFFGQVLDSKTGRPITGAEVWIERASTGKSKPREEWTSFDDILDGNPWTTGMEWTRSGELEAVTRDTGRFEIPVGSRRSAATAHVHAPGYGPAIFLVTDTRQEGHRPLVVRIARAAGIRGVMRDREKNPMPGLQIAVSAWAWSLCQGDSFDAVIAPYTWKARTRADGSFELPGLPAEVHLSMEVFDERKGALVLPRSALLLDYAEERTLDWTIGVLEVVRGILVDVNGAPVGGISIQLSPAVSQLGSTYLEPYDSYTKMARTNALGLFEFDAVTPGPCFVGPLAGVAPSPFAPLGVRVDVPFNGPLVLLAHKPLYIAGRFVSDDGRAMPGMLITATMENGRGSVSAESRANGRFRIGPLAPGPHRVWPGMDVDQVTLDSMPIDGWSEMPFRGWLPVSPPGVVPAGTTGLEIVMTRSGSIKGTAQDAVFGEPVKAQFALISWAQRAGLAEDWSPVDSDFHYQLLLPGSYTVVARTLDNRVGVLNGVAVVPDGDKAGLIIPVAEGSVLVVRSDDSDVIQYRVEVDGIAVGTFATDSGAVVVPPGDGQVIRLDGPTTESKSATFIAGELTVVTFDQEQ